MSGLQLAADSTEHVVRGELCAVSRGMFADRVVAVKALLPEHAGNHKLLRLLVQDIKLSMQLSHPNICHCYGGWRILREDARVYPSMVVEYAPLKLKTVLDNADGAFTLTEADKHRLVLELAQCLSYLHALTPPVYHCDLKPDNISLTTDLTVKLASFGISKIAYQEFLNDSARSTLQIRSASNYVVCVCLFV